MFAAILLRSLFDLQPTGEGVAMSANFVRRVRNLTRSAF
jgi:hypothetical protein